MKRRKHYVYDIPRDKLLEGKVTKKLAGEEHRCSWCNKCFKIAPIISQTFYMIKRKGQYEEFICYQCAFLRTLQYQRYGFWLRFLSKHFIPCEKCQDKLHEQINTQEVTFHEGHNDITMIISQENDKSMVKFRFGFLWRDSIFTPCKLCQKKVVGAWQTSQFHIGNDNKPLIEFWRDWADIKFKEINKPKLKKRICLHCGKEFMQTFEKQRFCEKHRPKG